MTKQQFIPTEDFWVVQQIFKMPSIVEIQAELEKRGHPPIAVGKYKVALQRKRATWQWLAIRLDYLHKVQSGYSPEDPAVRLESYHLALKQVLIIQSNYLFSILELLICDPTKPEELDGFKINKEKSRELKRNFPFETPRQLFVAICHSMAVHEFLLDISTDSADQLKKTKGNRRKHLTREKKLMAGHLEGEEHAKLLEKNLQGAWFEFWDVAIYEHRLKRPIRPYFKKYMKAYKEMSKLFSPKPIAGGAWTVFGIRDRNGNFIDPESRRLMPEA